MRVLRFIDDTGQTRLGCDPTPLHTQPGIYPSPDTSFPLLDGPDLGPWRLTDQRARLAQILPPIAPVNIFCIGLNYREHARETGAAIPRSPVIFMKPTSCVIAHNQPIRIPASADPQGEVDYECELAVVISRPARNVSTANALSHVLGYTIANDVSARRWQKTGGSGQWVRGKSFDTFCPLGPVLVTPDEVPDPNNLRLRTLLNGNVVQDSSTADMIFSVPELIAHLSRDTTLLPGTLILTGTPPGVGMARTPPLWLHPGDNLQLEIQSLGSLQNPIQPANP